MSNFIKKTNELTGKPYLQFDAKLINVSDELRENSNGTQFVLGNIQYVDPKGNVKNTSAMIYEKSLAHGMEPGQTYVTSMEQGEDGTVYVRMSHLQNTARVTATEFEDLFAEAVEIAPKAAVGSADASEVA